MLVVIRRVLLWLKRILIRHLLLVDLLVNSDYDALIAIFYNLVDLLIRFVGFPDQAWCGDYLPVSSE